ncbi:hypothetical protein DRQ53_05520 [bacterium]|nr:MAG: hypothetical protein DRQ53_05520 [bacterium]
MIQAGDPLFAPAAAQSPFLPFPALASPGAPRKMLTGDFNGDGLQDLAVASAADGRIRVHAVSPDGSFFVGASIFVGGTPAAIFTDDFDRDGNLDLAWADESSGDVGVLLLTPGHPIGSQELRQRGPDEATSVLLLDQDEDGWLDLLGAHGGADALVEYPNLAGDLGPGVVEEVGDRPDRLLLLDHAGGPTLVVRQSGRLSLNLQLTNLSDGRRDEVALPGGGEAFALDFDGDGQDELIYADEGALEIVVLAHDAGAWIEDWRFAMDGRVSGLAVAQADASTRRVAVASRERRRVTLYRIEGSAVLRESGWYSGGQMGEVIYEDMDRDGAPEVIVAQAVLNRLQILPPLGAGLLGAEAASAPRGAVHLARGLETDGSRLFVVSGFDEGRVGVYTPTGAVLGEPRFLDAAPGVRVSRIGQLDQIAGVDIVSASKNSGVRTHLSDGAGGYVAGSSFIPTDDVADIALVDVMGSPALDLILASLNPPALVVHEGLGDGTFVVEAAARIATVEPLVVVRAIDLDVDGRDDIVALGFDSLLTIFLNRAGEPLAGVDLLVRNAPRDVGVGNFNGDGLPDLITINEGGSDFSIVTSVLPGVYTVNVRGVFSLPGARRLEVADFNADGADDFCVIANGTRAIGMHLNLGTAEEPTTSFTPPVQFELVESAADFAVMDLDGDSKPDLVGLDGEADVLVSRPGDPLASVARPSAQLQIFETGLGRRVRILSSATHVHDLRLTRQPGPVVLSLSLVSPGLFEALDSDLPGGELVYVVEDRRGDELDRVVLSPRQATGAPATQSPLLLPALYRPGRAVLRMRAAAGVMPELRIFDLRGRRVTDLELVEESGGWYRGTWTGTDFRGRPVSRGRYLVRASLGPVTRTGSIHLR